jgi:hemoglobin-like flavoprotein
MDISESIKTILRREKNVTDQFYTILLNQYPDVGTFFKGVNLQQQAAMLNMALMMIEQYFQHRYPAAEQYLRLIGYRHAQQGIPSELYSRWRDCLLETLSLFHDDDWNDELRQQWKEAVDLASEVMLVGYESQQIY